MNLPLKKTLCLVLLSSVYAYSAETIANQIDDVMRHEEQKRVYNQFKDKAKKPMEIYTELKKAPMFEGANEGKCIKIDTIVANDITLIGRDKIDEMIAPYLHKCSTIKEISNLVKKINNIYIEKAYITSRAYIKPQDLSKGVLKISTVEGKIETIIGDGVRTNLVFLSPEDKFLNLRNLEMGIEQLNRLQSYQTKMKINPGSQTGYSEIVMKGKKVSFPLHGSLGVNNFGTEKTGKYQGNGSLSWENPFGLNDIISVGYNTTSKQDKENDSKGYYLEYGLPISRDYFKFKYSYFNYEQVVNGLNMDYSSSGNSKSFKLDIEHKLYHDKQMRGTIDFSFERKRNDNYLAGVFLDTSSSILAIGQLAYTHKFTSDTWDGYATFRYHQGFDIMGARSGSKTSPKFKKLTLDLSYNKKFNPENFYPVKFNSSFYGQYAKKGIIGSQQMGAGGPYSVRGFKSEGSLSGNTGFYLRNELSFLVEKKWGNISPYVGVDLGVVKHNDQSNGGRIIGGAVGVRANVGNFSVDLFATKPLDDSNEDKLSDIDDEIHSHSGKFVGINISYRF